LEMTTQVEGQGVGPERAARLGPGPRWGVTPRLARVWGLRPQRGRGAEPLALLRPTARIRSFRS
jgi:hypothetical protein